MSQHPPSQLQAMPPRLTAAELMAADLPARQTILDPLLATKSLALLYGPRGLGKTFMAMSIAWAVAGGGQFLNWRASRPHRVCYVDGEMPAVDMKERLRLLGAVPPSLSFLLADLNEKGIPDLGTTQGQIHLIESWGKQPELLVLDNLASLVGTRHNGSDRWSHVQDLLMYLRRTGVAVLLVHHANKAGEQRGTSRREDVLDLVLSLRRPTDYRASQGARFEIHFDKARGLHGDAVKPIEARLGTNADGRIHWTWQPAQDGELQRAVQLLNEGLNPLQVATALGLSKSTSYRLRERAGELGLLKAPPPLAGEANPIA